MTMEGNGRLRPPGGATTGVAPVRTRAADRPAPVKKPSTTSRLLKLALSGETAYNFVSKYAREAGLDYGDYEDANGVVQFVADTFLSPVGLASTIAAPVTGGASLGLKGAAGAAARVATRAGSELAVNAAANVGGKLVESALPEDTPGWARAGAMLVGAAAGGMGAARQITKLSGTEAARATLRAEQARAAQGTAGFGLSYKYLPEFDDFSKVADQMEAGQIGEGILGKAARFVNAATQASPASNYKGRFGAIAQAGENVKLRNDDFAQKFVARLFPNGQNAFETQGTMWKVGDGSWVPHQNVIGDLDAPTKYSLTPEQTAVRQVFRDARNDLDLLLASRGIDVPKVNLGKGQDYWPHYSTANINGDFRRTADRGRTRLYKTVDEGLANGVEYADPLSTLQAFTRNALEEVRLKDIGDEVSKLGVTIDAAALGTKEGRIANFKVRRIDKKIADTREAIKRAEASNKMSIGQGRAERNRLIKEHNALRKMQREYQRALKVSATAEFPAPRRGTTAVRKIQLIRAREKFKGVREEGLAGNLEAEGLVEGAQGYRGVMAAGKMPDRLAIPLAEQRDAHRLRMDEAIMGQGDEQYVNELGQRIADIRGALKTAGVRKSGNVPQLYAKLASYRKVQDKVRNDWTNVRNRTWDRLPGSVFGKGEEAIPVSLWHGKYYVPKGADYEQIASRYDAITGSPKGSGISSGLKAVEQVANLGRFTAATGDFAGAFTQGMPLLAYNPKGWAKMAATSFGAFIDPSVQGRYIEKNWDSINRMILDGVPGGDIEMLRAIKEGGLPEYLFKHNAVAQKTGISNLVQRFQSSYDTMLLVTRHQLYDTLLPVWKGERSALAKEINYMTGGLDPRAIGVGPTRQALESMTFFAPRMLRSTLSLAASAMKPWTPEGELAARTMMRLSAGMAGVMMMTNLGIAAINNEDDAQVQKRLDDMFDPTNGRKFLSVPIGDHYYGVGGQVRSITQLLAKAVTDPSSLTKADAMANPLMRFAGGRLSPAANTVLGAAELGTDEEHNFLPFNTIDNFPDLVGMTATSALPFAIQGAKEEGWDWSNPLTFANPLVTAAVEGGGVRATQFTENDILDKAAYDRYGLPFADLTGDEQAEVERIRPEAAKAREKLGTKSEKEYRAERVRLDDETNRALIIMQEQIVSGKMSRGQYRDARGEVLKNRAVKLEEAQRNFGIDYGAADTDKRRLSDDYFQTFDRADFSGTGAMIDWDYWETLQSELQQKIEAGVYGPKDRALQLLEERRRFNSPADDWFEENANVIRDNGYWEVRDSAFAKVSEAAKKINSNISSATQLDEAMQKAAAEGDIKLATRLGGLVQAMERVSSARKNVLRAKNPALDKALYDNGHVTTRMTRG